MSSPSSKTPLTRDEGDASDINEIVTPCREKLTFKISKQREDPAVDAYNTCKRLDSLEGTLVDILKNFQKGSRAAPPSLPHRSDGDGALPLDQENTDRAPHGDDVLSHRQTTLTKRTRLALSKGKIRVGDQNVPHMRVISAL